MNFPDFGVTGIDNYGDVVGLIAIDNTNPYGVRGAIDVNGANSYITDPADTPSPPNGSYSYRTVVTDINDNGVIVGYSRSGGFIDNNGIFTSGITNPLSETDGSCFEGINNNGEIVGNGYSVQYVSDFPYYSYGPQGGDAFLDVDGVFTKIIDPEATPGNPDNAWNATYVAGINDSGTIVGTYCDGYHYHGFVDNNGVFTTLDYLGGTNTWLTGINNNGQIIGFYELQVNYTINDIGFVATPGSTVLKSDLYLDASGTVDLTSVAQLSGTTIDLVAGDNTVIFGNDFAVCKCRQGIEHL